ncbi:uncharacterized protein LOC120606101 isoform X1 [Pteropus medius]|uniref:uncharacterized protein LOC120606101 isoform X1 n=1 Tax=Pteropus vampyrus TaxID=132908 RepID=UPI00196AB1C5|nr:uncharacterized protein LOC120606101 isoform X1 [Pteropus giganteus]XP_039723154.1 uncharacterized protein LOC120606101 isoform X1 [Pteropus giganteus]
MPLLGIYPKKTASLTQKDGCTPTSTAVSPTTAEIRSSPDSDRLRKRDTSEGDVEQNPAAWNKIVCIDLEGIVRSAMNQLNTLLFCVESQQTNNSTGRLETTDAMAREPPVQLEPQNPGSHPELHHVRPAHRPDPRRLPVRHLLHQENDRLLAAAQLPAHPAHAPGSHGGGGLPHGLPRPPGTGSGDHADCPARDLGQVGASPGARPADLHEHIRERTGTLHRPAADRVHLSVAGLAHGLLHFRSERLSTAFWLGLGPQVTERGGNSNCRNIVRCCLKCACGCALSLVWFALYHDNPEAHPCISVAERDFITASLAGQVSSSGHTLPIRAMLRSLPVWVISLTSFAYFWMMRIIIFYSPMFISSSLHTEVQENGMLSALPYLFAWILSFLSGPMADCFLARNILSMLTVRKLFTTLGLLLPAVFSVCLASAGSSIQSVVVFLVLTNATTSFCTVGMLINPLDIAPRYYGFLKGMTILIGMTGGLISTTVTGIILDQDPESSWFKIFFLMAAINVTSLILYLIFAKAEIQDWAKERQHTRL